MLRIKSDFVASLAFLSAPVGFRSAGMRSKGDTKLSLTGRVRYQSCDDESCGLPASEPFDLSIELAPIARTRLGNAKEGEMDSLPYLKDMMRRRK